jgi:hypothetical protein
MAGRASDDDRLHNIPRDEVTLATVMGCLHTSLIASLRSLALAHGNKSGPWLDDLEAEIMGEIKSSYLVGPGIDDEARAFRVAHDLIVDILQQVRAALP